MYENTPIVPITPYHVPYVPSFHHTVPSTQHHPTVSTQLPNVNEALSKVENDLQSLNDTLSHPHTINDPISFIRASQISSQVQQLKKKCPLLKSNHKCPQAVCSVRDLVPSSNQPKMSPFPPTLFPPQAFVPIIPNHPTRMIARVPSHPNPSQSTRTIKQKKISVSKRDSRVIFLSPGPRVCLFFST